MTVGGGIRSLNDIHRILRAGADKISINTAAIKNPYFIKEAVEHYGASTIVISMEVIMQHDGSYLLFTDNGREHTGINLEYWLEKIQELGAGEIILTSVDKEGTMSGLDIDLLAKVKKYVNVPMIIHGGIGQLCDLKILSKLKISGIAIASAFHYNYLSSIQSSDNDFIEGNIDYIMEHNNIKKGFSIPDLKDYLRSEGISVRHY